MTLAGFLEQKGYDNETIRQTVSLWEWDLPLQSRQLENDCYEWWDSHWNRKGLKHGQKLERTKNKTS